MESSYDKLRPRSKGAKCAMSLGGELITNAADFKPPKTALAK
jgi:hypothetical protein